jgi:hypothetical protein
MDFKHIEHELGLLEMRLELLTIELATLAEVANEIEAQAKKLMEQYK